MLPIEPNTTQHRLAAVALLIIAAFTAAMVAVQWVEKLDEPLLLPAAVAYFLFNFGYVFAVVKGRLQTRGARLGLVAVMLNFLAMFLVDIAAIWTALSLCSVIAALASSFLLFKDARSAAA